MMNQKEKVEPKFENYCTFCNMIASDDGLTFDDLKTHIFDEEGNQTTHVPGCPMGTIKDDKKVEVIANGST